MSDEKNDEQGALVQPDANDLTDENEPRQQPLPMPNVQAWMQRSTYSGPLPSPDIFVHYPPNVQEWILEQAKASMEHDRAIDLHNMEAQKTQIANAKETTDKTLDAWEKDRVRDHEYRLRALAFASLLVGGLVTALVVLKAIAPDSPYIQGIVIALGLLCGAFVVGGGIVSALKNRNRAKDPPALPSPNSNLIESEPNAGQKDA